MSSSNPPPPSKISSLSLPTPSGLSSISLSPSYQFLATATPTTLTLLRLSPLSGLKTHATLNATQYFTAPTTVSKTHSSSTSGKNKRPDVRDTFSLPKSKPAFQSMNVKIVDVAWGAGDCGGGSSGRKNQLEREARRRVLMRLVNNSSGGSNNNNINNNNYRSGHSSIAGSQSSMNSNSSFGALEGLYSSNNSSDGDKTASKPFDLKMEFDGDDQKKADRGQDSDSSADEELSGHNEDKKDEYAPPDLIAASGSNGVIVIWNTSSLSVDSGKEGYGKSGGNNNTRVSPLTIIPALGSSSTSNNSNNNSNNSNNSSNNNNRKK